MLNELAAILSNQTNRETFHKSIKSYNSGFLNANEFNNLKTQHSDTFIAIEKIGSTRFYDLMKTNAQRYKKKEGMDEFNNSSEFVNISNFINAACNPEIIKTIKSTYLALHNK